MSVNRIAQEIRDQVSLVDLLARLGYRPVKTSGDEQFYLSMLRQARSACFIVNDKLGVWFDHAGTNPSGIRGGNIIDFCKAYWYPSSLEEVVEKMSVLCSTAQAPETGAGHNTARRPRMPVRVPHYRVADVKDLGHNPDVTGYLQLRGVWPVAHPFVREVHYFVEDAKKFRRHFCSAGWPNENGGWELSNPYFKGCIGTKGLSFVSGDPERLVVFQNMIDYLSWSYEQPQSIETALILNGVSFIDSALRRASPYREVTTFFNRDDAGEKAVCAFRSAMPQAADGSAKYEGYNNYNHKLMAQRREVFKQTGVSATVIS